MWPVEREIAGALIVAVTGCGQEADWRLAVESGFDEPFAKPVHIDRLLAVLSQGASARAQ